VAEGFLVAFQGRFHLLIIARVSLQHYVLRDQQMYSSFLCRKSAEKRYFS